MQAVTRRLEQIEAMLTRGRARGEKAPDISEVVDHLLSPLYMRTLFGVPTNAATAERLVTWLMSYVKLRT